MAGPNSTEPDSKTVRLLHTAIEAARRGDRMAARRDLLCVVEVDETNATAWFWLSDVVDSAEERRICLENVLVLDPTHQAARRRLHELPGSSDSRIVMAGEMTAKLAAPAFPVVSESSYDDVWTGGNTLCAHCAAELDFDAEVCPRCRRKLYVRRYRYERPSTNFWVFLVFVIAAANMYLINVLADIVSNTGPALIVLHIFLALVLFGLSMGLYLRRFWAYVSTLILLLVLVALSGWDVLGLAGGNLPVSSDPARAMIASPFVGTFGNALTVFQFGTLVLALVSGTLLVAADFARDKQRQVARLEPLGSDAAAYYQVGRRLRHAGLLASATLHFQRAAANAPHNTRYLLALAETYARLGFRARAEDVLATARMQTQNPQILADIRQIEGILVAASENRDHQ